MFAAFLLNPKDVQVAESTPSWKAVGRSFLVAIPSLFLVVIVLGGISIGSVVRPLLPIFVAMVIGLLAITYIPSLSLWLPRLLGL